MRWFALLCFTLAIHAGAQSIPGFAPENSAEANGRALADEAARRDDGFSDSQAAMTMTLFDGRGNSVSRSMQSKTREMANDGDRTVLIFEDPRDVRGTAFLTHSHADRVNDQWLYLPALKRVKRIAANRRNGAFMSSEFSYEDLGNDEVDKYHYRYIGEVVLDDIETHHMERVPTGNSGYSRQEVWLDKEALRLVRVDYYDRGGTLLKTLAVSEFQQYLGKYWRPHRMHMRNVQNGRETVLTWRNYAFNNDLDESEFEPSRLDRWR
ncbi:MAG: outer membrane lipoprotein-sorting protein [Pseudomonadota bacterium]